jgi:hypothetical protein
MSTRELVDALIAGDSIAIENTFNDAMSEKISVALDDYRIEVAQKMFGVEQTTAEVDDQL